MAEHIHRRARVGSDKIEPDDPRYGDLASRGSKRFAGTPDYVRLVSSTDQVVAAVHDAVREQRHLAVRSGGHCLEGFVADPAVRVVIDTSPMTNVYYDPEMGAFAVEAGATVGEAYRRLFLGWGVTIPAGESPDIGVGGHPKAPDAVATLRVAWNWEGIDEGAFTRLARNFGDWCERNGGAGSP